MNVAPLAAAALAFNAFVWGVSWWPFRFLEAHGVHPLWATAFVYGFSFCCVMLVRPGAMRLLARHPQLLLLALSAGMTNVGFNWAVTVGDVVRVVLLFYVMPVWTALLAWLLLRERPTPVSLACLVLALTGVAIVLKTPGTAWPFPQSLPDWLGLMAGFFFSLTNILLRKFSSTPGDARVLAMFGGGAVMASLTALAVQGIALPAAPGAAVVVVALVLSAAFLAGNIALQYGAARLPAHTTSLVMLSEVVFASASSVALGAAVFTGRTALGAMLIVLAAGWSAWPREPR